MGLALPLLLAAAAAASTAEPPFSITNGRGTFEFTSFPRPPARALAEAARTCRVRLAWDGHHLVAHEDGCPEAVAPEVLYTVERWAVAGPPIATDEVGEVWFVYPVDRPGTPRVMVRQAHDQSLTLPSSVDAVPFVIRAWSFLRWPEGVHRADLPDVTCFAQIHADTRGAAVEVDVDGDACTDVYRAAVRSAVGAWRFEPPLVDGHPIDTALSLEVTFVAAAPTKEPEYVPSPESHALWAARQFDAMSREDRLWFIEEALLGGDDDRDLGPGQVKVALPRAPNLGEREPPRFFVQANGYAVRALPEHPPLMLLGEREHLGIEVYELILPDTHLDHPAECALLVQVDGERHVFSWAEPGCDPAARAPSLAAADAWLLRHDGAATAAARARFRATFRFDGPAEGPDDATTADVLLDADEVRTPLGELPPGVHVHRDAKAVDRVPPKVRRGRPMPEGSCVLSVALTDTGRPRTIAPIACDDALTGLAVKAVKQWRWEPASTDGQPVPSTTEVTIRFQP